VRRLADMIRIAVGGAGLALSLGAPAHADPVRLKFAFFASDRQFAYGGVVKPFADAVTLASNGAVAIDVHTSGVLERNYVQQLQLVRSGGADMAWVHPGLTPEAFPDNPVMELPNLFREAGEATEVFTHLITVGKLRGYEDMVVIGAFGSAPLTIHARVPVTSLADLKGKRIRTANETEGMVLKALGMAPEVMPINQTADALNRGAIDGATAAMEVLADFGISRFANHHYMLPLGSVPLLILMNRASFERLPVAGQRAIQEHSGKWTGDRYVATVARYESEIVRKLKAEPRRKIVNPSAADLDTARLTFRTVIGQWAAENPRARELLSIAEADLGKLRATR
jgi:TRAP-type C4-dicarboxylate transport system substrate-binding protein